MLGFVGVIVMDTSAASVMVSVVSPTTFPRIARMIDFPTALAYAFPGLSSVVIVISDELQVTNVVKSLVVLSE
jgi:hypothetical protein